MTGLTTIGFLGAQLNRMIDSFQSRDVAEEEKDLVFLAKIVSSFAPDDVIIQYDGELLSIQGAGVTPTLSGFTALAKQLAFHNIASIRIKPEVPPQVLADVIRALASNNEGGPFGVTDNDVVIERRKLETS